MRAELETCQNCGGKLDFAGTPESVRCTYCDRTTHFVWSADGEGEATIASVPRGPLPSRVIRIGRWALLASPLIGLLIWAAWQDHNTGKRYASKPDARMCALESEPSGATITRVDHNLREALAGLGPSTHVEDGEVLGTTPMTYPWDDPPGGTLDLGMGLSGTTPPRKLDIELTLAGYQPLIIQHACHEPHVLKPIGK
jgi:hypothetical protein